MSDIGAMGAADGLGHILFSGLFPAGRSIACYPFLNTLSSLRCCMKVHRYSVCKKNRIVDKEAC